jgi:protein involved in polysaccharide export with SLBB domain
MNLERSVVCRSWCAVILSLACLSLLSCLPKNTADLPQSMAIQPLEAGQYRIQTGDILTVKFPYTEVHNEEVTVMPDGKIALQVGGKLSAAGLTTEELTEQIRQSTSVRLKAPKVVVSVKQSSQKVYIGGDVGMPGPVPYREGLTALQAIFERQGFRDTGDSNNVVLVRQGKDGFTSTHMGIEQIASVSLLPNDVVYVPRTSIGYADLAVKQYLTDIIFIRANASVAPTY